jgi:DNA-binding transcriptional LysR family regulator
MSDATLTIHDREQLTAHDRWLCVELRHLAALEAIVREGTFRGAAERLGYVQSAISQQLSYLERLAGTRLIERSRGNAPITLTEAGALLLEHVDAVLARFHAAQSELTALVDGEAGTLRLGAFQSVASRILPHLLPGFTRSQSSVRVVPTETQTDLALFELVERGALDLAFCQLPLVDGPFERLELMHDPYVLLISSDSPLADREQAPPLSEIARMPLIGYNDPRAQQEAIAALQASGVEPEVRLHTDLDATLQAFVAADLGAAIVPYLSVDPQHPGTTVLELPELPARTIALIWHRERELPPSAEPFVQTARATCERLFRHAGR